MNYFTLAKFVIKPDNLLIISWNLLVLVITSLSIVYLPLKIAFFDEDILKEFSEKF